MLGRLVIDDSAGSDHLNDQQIKSRVQDIDRWGPVASYDVQMTRRNLVKLPDYLPLLFAGTTDDGGVQCVMTCVMLSV